MKILIVTDSDLQIPVPQSLDLQELTKEELHPLPSQTSHLKLDSLADSSSEKGHLQDKHLYEQQKKIAQIGQWCGEVWS